MDKQLQMAFLFLSILLITSVVYSKFLLSVSMFGWVILGFYTFKKPFRIWEDKALLLTIGLFLMMVLSGINSDNTQEWLHHVRIKLPFLALPVAMYMIPRPHRRDYFLIQYFIILILVISSIPIMYHVITEFDSVYQGLAEGRPIATPIQHTKYSLIVAYGIITGIIIIKEGVPYAKYITRGIMIGVVVYLFIFLHVLAVRSGLVVFYVTALLMVAIYAFRQRSFRPLIFALILSIVLPLLGFLFIPSLNKRVHYMIYDLKEYTKDGGDQYSDSDRINSLVVGWEIFKENPIIGTGIGDLKDECAEKYEKKFGPDKYILYPHNQYLFMMAGAGLTGLIVFIIFFIGPVLINRHYSNWFLLAVILIYGLGFLFDNVLERSFSVGFYAFMLSIGIRSRYHGTRE
jgi:O-antigen ligase